MTHTKEKAMKSSPSLLLLDAYDLSGRNMLTKFGVTLAGELFNEKIKKYLPDARVDLKFPADQDCPLPSPTELKNYDGVLWTGSSLTIHHKSPEVLRQIEFAVKTYESGVPAFGSCWAAQLAAVAAGGSCGPHPLGREFGIGRKITLSDSGKDHFLFQGKSEIFDALTSHTDHIERLPEKATLLAGNSYSAVQALEVRHLNGTFSAIQYHPEYDLEVIAGLAKLRSDELISLNYFRDQEDCNSYTDKLVILHHNPERRDISWQFGLGLDVLDPDIRDLEFRNWLRHGLGQG